MDEELCAPAVTPPSGEKHYRKFGLPNAKRAKIADCAKFSPSATEEAGESSSPFSQRGTSSASKPADRAPNSSADPLEPSSTGEFSSEATFPPAAVKDIYPTDGSSTQSNADTPSLSSHKVTNKVIKIHPKYGAYETGIVFELPVTVNPVGGYSPEFVSNVNKTLMRNQQIAETKEKEVKEINRELNRELEYYREGVAKGQLEVSRERKDVAAMREEVNKAKLAVEDRKRILNGTEERLSERENATAQREKAALEKEKELRERERELFEKEKSFEERLAKMKVMGLLHGNDSSIGSSSPDLTSSASFPLLLTPSTKWL